MKTKSNGKSQLRSAVLVVWAWGLVLLSGCLSPDAANQIKSFSNAVSLTVTNTTAAYALVNQAHVEAEIGYVFVRGDSSAVELNEFPGFFSTNDLEVRQQVLAGLETYAARLSALMGNSRTNLDQNTTKLGNNLIGLNNDAVTNAYMKLFSSVTNVTSPVTSADIQIFTTAVNVLGHWIIELKEQSEARKCIEAMQAPTNLPAICHVLTNDFLFLTSQFSSDAAQIVLDEKQFLNKYKDLNPIQQRTEIRRLIELEAARLKGAAVLEATRESIVKMAEAHQALEEAFSKHATNLSSLINEVTSEGQRIAAYYNSLRTNN